MLLCVYWNTLLTLPSEYQKGIQHEIEGLNKNIQVANWTKNRFSKIWKKVKIKKMRYLCVIGDHGDHGLVGDLR
jgi:hypothetical protein